MRINVNPPESLLIQSIKTKDPVIANLMTATHSQIDTWVDNNVNTIADVRMIMKRLIKIFAFLLRKAK